MAILTSILSPTVVAYVDRVRMSNEIAPYGLTYLSHKKVDDSNVIVYAKTADGAPYKITLKINGESDNCYEIVDGLFGQQYVEPTEPQEPDYELIPIPNGYKFVMWADEEKTSYVIEDAEGNQQVIIIEKN